MPKLHIVPTPIGNLDDITLRAIKVLQEVDIIYAEDTRTSQVLLKHLNIHKILRSFHLHNEHQLAKSIALEAQSGKRLALISDAGTPGISDPGYLLVRACIAEGVEVECLPGPTAFVPAIVVSGLPCESFVFFGFLPHKKGRATKIAALHDEKKTMVFYESPHRLSKFLLELSTSLGAERNAFVGRELTKKFEEQKRGSLSELHKYFSKSKVKGEIVVVVEGKIKNKKIGQET